jgi:hypothetical protein
MAGIAFVAIGARSDWGGQRARNQWAVCDYRNADGVADRFAKATAAQRHWILLEKGHPYD